MKSSAWKRMVRPLVPAGESWQFRNSLCYRAPVERILFGVLAEGSGFTSGVYLWRVSMPLFVESDGVVDLSYSDRIGGGAMRFNEDDPDEISSAIASGFRDIPSEEDELGRIAKLATGSASLRLLEAAAYSHVILGDSSKAMEAIKEAVRQEVEVEWEANIVDRLRELAVTLATKGLEPATLDADAQVSRTASALGLNRG